MLCHGNLQLWRSAWADYDPFRGLWTLSFTLFLLVSSYHILRHLCGSSGASFRAFSVPVWRFQGVSGACPRRQENRVTGGLRSSRRNGPTFLGRLFWGGGCARATRTYRMSICWDPPGYAVELSPKWTHTYC